MESELTLSAMLQDTTARVADRVAVIEQSGDRVTKLTFAEFDAAVAHTAEAMQQRGVRRGDVVGVWLPNWIEALVCEFALADLGASNLGINTRYSLHELTHLLTLGQPVGLVMPARFLTLDFAGRLRSAVGAAATQAPGFRIPWVAYARAAGEDVPDLDIDAETWHLASVPAAASRGGERPSSARPEDVVNHFTTSGSTGLPKLAGHDQQAVVAHCRNVSAAFDMHSGDCFLGVLPLSGVFGFNPAMAMLSAGGTCLLEPAFDAGAALRSMDEFAVTHAVGGDDMFGRLMDAWYGERLPLRSFRRGGIADFAGRAAAVVTWAEEELDARIAGVYGSSELFSLTATWAPERPLDERVRGGGALVSEAIRVRAVDPETGEVCAAGTVGELQFTGYNVVTGYLGNARAMNDAFTDDGWFRSGDLGFLGEDADEFVYVCRAGDALRLRGFLVEPAEIEQFLLSHPKVDGAKVVGVSRDGGDIAVGFVTLVAGEQTDEAELRAYCRERLAPFKVPTRLNVIDEFPVTTGTNGTKIRAAELRRWAAEQIAAES